MIELTVRTLDSQNHPFTVEDDITVEQFKAKIADTVNIPADTQRIIYCGRVLNDSSKLSEYDVNGKVVHLVQRPPPNTNQRPSRTASPQRPRRGVLRGFDHGNTMYLGSMAFPSNLMESQGFIPPPPTHSLAGSRLNVAKRMLRKAEAVIRLLENPSARPSEQTPPEENQEEEVTPVIEARVIVPSNTNEPIDEAMVLSVVQDSLYNAGSVPITREENNTSTAAGGASQSNDQSTSSTPGTSTPRGSSTENLSEQPRSENASGNALTEMASRTSEMAELLTMLGQLQTRFAPFLERYQTFMQEDPVVATENVRSTQLMITQVSEVLHFFSHAYHSLSDIIVRVRTPPPRPLLCRPILIQHSAVVQAGIPIQVEINLSTERQPASTTGPTTTSGNTATTTSANQSSATETSSSSANNAEGTSTRAPSAPPPPPPPTFSAQIEPGMMPFLPGIRVQSFPSHIRAMARNAAAQRAQNNNTADAGGENAQPTAAPAAASASGPAPSSAAGAAAGAAGGAFNFNNPNVEFFMQVTPEGITIDSMETALVGPNQANDLLRGALNAPPPELLQSLMQMAGQIIDRTGAVPSNVTVSSSSDAASSPSSNQSSTNGNQQAQSAAGQNSQARGNTQTNPTTATHTRSTPRPHVHLAQQAMQAGFDPFLPCNSHHVTHRRSAAQQRGQPEGAAQEGGATRGQQGTRPQNIYNFINDVLSSIRNVQPRRGASEPPQAQSTPAGASAAQSSTSAPAGAAQSSGTSSGGSSAEGVNVNIPLPPLQALFSSMGGTQSIGDLLRQGPTIYQILQQFQQDDSYVQGESIITDLIMLLFRNLTLVDICTLNNGNGDPINRCRSEIENFVRTRILDNDTSPEGVNSGAERILTEMRPFFENFRLIPARDNIDVVRSSENIFRTRIPNMINLAINLNPSNIRVLIDHCLTTIKHLCALTLRACSTGQPGVEQVFEQILERYLDVPPEMQQWTFLSSRVHLRQFLSNLSVPENVLQPYIVHMAPVQPAVSVAEPVTNEVSAGDACVQNNVQPVTAMELDDQEQEASGSGNELGTPGIILEDSEPLPNIVLGSEPWHAQVPADWVPIIARDAQKQRRQNPQGPFSDAYLSGMPSKRRKIVNSSKPQGSLPQVISESVRQAVTSSGLASAAPLDAVVQAAGESIEIQTAYRNLLRSSVQASLRENEDFTPERYPNASNYFNHPQ
ncbi:unnamed protein product [Brassicogethes aeneus]|uniref:Large proline-rich protein BAG6 n=1 Tax=Brassicogethes aeneus TaxID=1431903 RepID=A0A9P0FA03_BRAAE|nr:unnamed protein product [Brassicogethes aeneus]